MSALLRTEDVAVHFDGLVALGDVSIEVQPGSITGLIGPNGAGKTTLFNVISGLQPATDGSVFFDGQNIERLPAYARARLGIRRSWQNLGVMLDQTVETNILAGQHLAADYRPLDPLIRPWRWRRSERDLARRADMWRDRMHLGAYAGERVSGLSFGVARFVELASILVAEPRLLLLDEPTTGLDSAESSRLAEVLLEVKREGKTILLIAHDVAFVMEVCDDIFVLASGEVICSGPPAEVQRDEAVIDAYLGTVRG